MVYLLLAVLALFCVVVGIQLAGPQGANVIALIMFMVIAVAALQAGYVGTVIVKGLF